MNPTEVFLEAVTKDDDARVEELLNSSPELIESRNEQGVSAPLLALYHRKRERAEALAREKEKREPLDVFEAAAFGRLKRVEALLLESPELANAYAPDGFYPLGLAAFFGREDAVRRLLAAGADPELAARNPMQVRAIHAACSAQSLPIVRALLDAGADVNATQQAGFTPLHAAAMSGDLELARLLVERGADPAIATEDGRTALDIARDGKRDKVVAFLERRS